jgi:hypothetical protein
MIFFKILWLKFQLWREMRPLSPAQKKQLVTRIWWEIEDPLMTYKGAHELRIRIHATQMYKTQLEKRFNN